MDLSWIDEYVNGTMDYCNSEDIYEIYDILNIEIIKINKDNYLLQENEALYVRSYFDKEIVFIRDDLDYRYKKFILAHELGHAIQHKGLNICFLNNSTFFSTNKFEREANLFCAYLLFTDEVLYKYHGSGFTMEQIAAAEKADCRLLKLIT